MFKELPVELLEPLKTLAKTIKNLQITDCRLTEKFSKCLSRIIMDLGLITI
jgi:hypothetical protein